MFLKNNQKQLKTNKKNEVKSVKSLWSSDKQLASVKDFISNEKLNPEIISVIERIGTKK